MRQIIGHSLQLEEPPSQQLTATIVGGTSSACILLSFLHVWQAAIIYRCLEYYEYEAKCRLEEGIAREQMQYESRLDVEHTADEVNANQTLSRSLLFPYPYHIEHIANGSFSLAF
ncbi:hypothetical protein WR25_09177 [Diploscapter pachys]|nr:hypothetical protein WR25_09177 [Diploscapter pachys]